MGGGIGLNAFLHGLDVRAAAFSGPMWGIKMPIWQRPLAWILGLGARLIGQAQRYAPTTGPETYVLTAPFEDNMLTTDPEMYALMQRQLRAHPELALGGPSLNWLIEAMAGTGRMASRPSPALPCHTAVGRNERIVDIPAIVTRMQSWPGGTLDLIDGAEHEIVMERRDVRERFFGAAFRLFAAKP
jgi:lysophospholipase